MPGTRHCLFGGPEKLEIEFERAKTKEEKRKIAKKLIHGDIHRLHNPEIRKFILSRKKQEEFLYLSEKGKEDFIRNIGSLSVEYYFSYTIGSEKGRLKMIRNKLKQISIGLIPSYGGKGRPGLIKNMDAKNMKEYYKGLRLSLRRLKSQLKENTWIKAKKIYGKMIKLTPRGAIMRGAVKIADISVGIDTPGQAAIKIIASLKNISVRSIKKVLKQ